MAIHPELLAILRCPKCLGVVKERESEGLVCEACRLVYPVVNEIPNLLVDQARPLASGAGG